MKDPKRFWNPYLAGAALGLVLVSSYVLLDKGLGASGASWRIGLAAVQAVAPGHVAASPAMARTVAKGGVLDDWLVYMFIGIVLGGIVGAYTSGRLGREVLRGPRISARTRIVLALAGGFLMGFAAKMARGCTSGQALTGAALLSAGSWAFAFAVFAGGYAAVWFVRREWR